jgi:hypothetical protein
MNNEVHKIKECRLCFSKNIKKVFDLNSTPLANNLINKKNLNKKDEVFPLCLVFCKKCGHIQLSHTVSPKKLFENYLYLTNTSKQNRVHFRNYFLEISKKFKKKDKVKVLDIASNDGTFLGFFKNRKFFKVGIDPAKNLLRFAKKNKIKQLPIFFTEKNSLKLLKKFGNFDVITANNVCAHVANLYDFFLGVKNLLSDKGMFIFEVSYLGDVIKKKTFDTIYHEHLDYHALKPLLTFVKKFGLEIFDFKRTEAQGGSIRIYVAKINSKKVNEKKINNQIKLENNNLKLFNLNTYIKFNKEVDLVGRKLRKILKKIKDQGNNIVGYGAAAKTTTLTNYFKIDGKYLDFIVDDNRLKQNLYTPKNKILIKNSKAIYNYKPNYVIILAWNYSKHIMKIHKKIKKFGKFIVPFPKIKIHK